jgi:type IV pilus assembly protein PilE
MGGQGLIHYNGANVKITDGGLMRSRSAGFTLVELLVAVAILGILAAVAVASYQDHVASAKRAAAKAVLVEAGNWLERQYTVNGCYNYASPANCASQSGTATALPGALDSSPREGDRESYRVTVAFANSGQTYTLSATPCGNGGANCTNGQHDSFTDAKCNVLTLDSLGTQGESGSSSAADCWQR